MVTGAKNSSADNGLTSPKRIKKRNPRSGLGQPKPPILGPSHARPPRPRQGIGLTQKLNLQASPHHSGDNGPDLMPPLIGDRAFGKSRPIGIGIGGVPLVNSPPPKKIMTQEQLVTPTLGGHHSQRVKQGMKLNKINKPARL